MIIPVLHQLLGYGLAPPALPDDPEHCAVPLEAMIGPRDGEGADAFAFMVVTPSWLAGEPGARWGRGFLIVPRFDWTVVEELLERLLARCCRESWSAVAAELNKELEWEYDDYRAVEV